MNILFIALDTLRADHLGCYGYPRDTSPRLDALAAEGIRFDFCISEGAHTVPAFTSMASGLSPLSHRVVGTNWCMPNENVDLLDDDAPVLAEALQQHGYVTAAVDNLLHAMRFHPKWFVRGFEYYINTSPKYIEGKTRADHVNERAIPWIKAHATERFYLFLHYWDPHQRYSPPAPFDAMFPASGQGMEPKKLGDNRTFFPRCGPADMDEGKWKQIAAYDGEIRYVDDRVGQILALLKTLDIYDRTLIIVTGDHGDDMAEHTCNFEHREVYDSCVRVPLIYKLPKDMQTGHNTGIVSPALVQHEDLMPTILELADVKNIPRMDGCSVRGLLMGGVAKHRPQTFSTGTWLWDTDHWKSAEMCVRTEEWKYIRRADIAPVVPRSKELIGLFRRKPNDFIRLPARELIDLKNDPEEQINVLDKNTDVAEKLDALLKPWIESGLFVK
ncbi:MAG: sulfatase [Planctomycetota bacterium]